MNLENRYLRLLADICTNGDRKKDRTGTGTYHVFGCRLQASMEDGFPIFTTKFVRFRAVRAELLWFLSGSTNTNDLDASIWNPWAADDGDLGPIYGKQWRAWPTSDDGTVDQIAEVQRSLREDPDSRRHIVSAWNVSDLDAMALAPCHVLFQFNSRTVPYSDERVLDLQLYQRSADMFLGVPFNIASYALLLHMMAQTTGHIPGDFIWVGGDCHVYRNHLEQVSIQVDRVPRHSPSLWLNPAVKDIDDFTAADIRLNNYDPHPAIPAPVAV